MEIGRLQSGTGPTLAVRVYINACFAEVRRGQGSFPFANGQSRNSLAGDCHRAYMSPSAKSKLDAQSLSIVPYVASFW